MPVLGPKEYFNLYFLVHSNNTLRNVYAKFEKQIFNGF